MTRRANGRPGRAEGRASGRLQAEALHLDLIDAAGESRDQRAAPPAKEPTPVAMDTYRPKRPTTLNLFPQVPRTQVSPPFPPLSRAWNRTPPGTGRYQRGYRDRVGRLTVEVSVDDSRNQTGAVWDCPRLSEN